MSSGRGARGPDAGVAPEVFAGIVQVVRWAGRGFAMGDAPEEVKAAADDVTKTIDDGGPAAELRAWFG